MSIRKFAESNCPVCDSQFTVYLRDVRANVLNRDIPLYYCMDCGSLNNSVGYMEDDDKQRRDANWHLDVRERNEGWARNFLAAVKHKFPDIKSILEIGCGTGTLLNIAQKEYGMKVLGYDTNKHAIELGKQTYPDIPMVCDMWDQDTNSKKYDLIISISTFEHLAKPRQLFGEIADYCSRHGSAVYISVPYFERESWPELLQEDTASEPGTFLYLADVHVTHFTKRGLVTMAGQFGAKSVSFFPRGWRGHWIEFKDRDMA